VITFSDKALHSATTVVFSSVPTEKKAEFHLQVSENEY
jgi:hypothetical protein